MRRLVMGLVLIVLLAGCQLLPEETPLPAVPSEVPTEQVSGQETQASPVTGDQASALLTPRPTPKQATPTPDANSAPAPVAETGGEGIGGQGPGNTVGFPFTVQAQTPLYVPNFAHSELGCNWLGVAGQVFRSEGLPVDDLVISVQGNLNGQPVDLLGYAGLATDYGPGGYEIKLGDAPASGIFWIDFTDLQGNRLAESVTFTTTADCQSNLVIINFVEQGLDIQLTPAAYLPLITD